MFARRAYFSSGSGGPFSRGARRSNFRLPSLCGYCAYGYSGQDLSPVAAAFSPLLGLGTHQQCGRHHQLYLTWFGTAAACIWCGQNRWRKNPRRQTPKRKHFCDPGRKGAKAIRWGVDDLWPERGDVYRRGLWWCCLRCFRSDHKHIFGVCLFLSGRDS